MPTDMRIRRRLTRFFFRLFYRKLWAQILPILLLTATIPVVLLGILLINTSQQAVRHTMLSNHKEIAVIAAGEIDLFMRRIKDFLNIAAAMLSESYPAFWKQETILVELGLDQPMFTRIVSVDLEGRSLASSALGKEAGWRYPDGLLRKALQGRDAVSQVRLSENNLPFVTLAVPIIKMGRVVGALIADVDLRGVWDVVDGIKMGRTGRSFLVAQDGTLIAHNDKKLVLKKLNLSGQRDVQSVLAGEAGAARIKDARGKEWLSSYAPIPGVDWGIVLRQKQDEAFLFSRTMKMQSLFAIIISEFLAIGVSVFIALFLTRRIKTLASRIRSVPEGDLDYKIVVDKRDEIGELIRSFNDMTQKLKQARERARLSAIGEAAAWISHELKNSLMLLKSFVQSFPQEHDDENFVDRFGRLVPPEVSRWERMLDEFSGLSSEDELKVSRTDIGWLLGNTLELMSEKLKEKNITMNYLRPTRPLIIPADQERLKQAFVNLIINAINAMPEGGSLTVWSAFTPAEDAGEPRFIEVRLKDTGKGMSAETVEKIFDPFRMQSHDGRGLGLLITRKIIEQHGGGIDVESKVGAGSTFIVTLPMEISPGITR